MTESDLHLLEDQAIEADAEDALRRWRSMFYIPRNSSGDEVVYLCGNSLGLRPRGVKGALEQELRDWERLGVHGHFRAEAPWYSYHENFRDTAAAVVGAQPGEVVIMNSLTVNLHLMMTSFYHPTPTRRKILIDRPIFPSDLYAVKSHLALHSFDPHEDLIQVGDSDHIDEDEVEALLAREGESIALVLLAGVNYLTGQYLDIPRLTRAGHAAGCIVGFDLAHAAGNVPMALHDWGVDFAVWCTYKYLNSGPGAVGGCFVHDRHAHGARPRMAGWWGNDPETRFDMPETFVPQAGAAGWQLSNAPVLSMAACRVSHDIFGEVGMKALREKSLRLTQTLHDQLQALPNRPFEIITPTDPARRGCQLSLRVRADIDPRALLARFDDCGIVCDFRRPDILRIAPVPLYNTFHDVWRFIEAVARI
ncbi:MAG: kynureninase [Proteobacteria bacterium]|nr:kynureninase [Pseudomonadota bacterium]